MNLWFIMIIIISMFLKASSFGDILSNQIGLFRFEKLDLEVYEDSISTGKMAQVGTYPIAEGGISSEIYGKSKGKDSTMYDISWNFLLLAIVSIVNLLLNIYPFDVAY